jgi:ribosome-associated heat shock protein Hsp15
MKESFKQSTIPAETQRQSRVACSRQASTFLTMQVVDRVRIDKWLWAVRLYKSRSLATSACNAGHVKIGGSSVKASREVQAGEIIFALTGRIHRVVKVLALLEDRVGAKLVAHYLEDQTPPEEYARAREEAARAAQLPRSLGRPTKKQRRQLEGFLERAAQRSP